MPNIHESVQKAIQQYQPGLEADGAGLELLKVNGEKVNLKLNIQAASCLDCILPKHLLEEMLKNSIESIYGNRVSIDLDDPRDK